MFDKKFALDLLGEDDEEETVNLMCDTFLEEPLTKACKISRERYIQFCIDVFREAVKQQFAYGFFDLEVNKLSSFWICEEDHSFDGNDEFVDIIIPEMMPIFDILEKVHGKLGDALFDLCNAQDLRREKILHMFMVGVNPRYRGENIAHRFTKEILEINTNLGFTIAAVEATNPGSRKFLEDLGFKNGGEVLYDKPPFDTIPSLFNSKKHKCDRTTLLLKRISFANNLT